MSVNMIDPLAAYFLGKIQSTRDLQVRWDMEAALNELGYWLFVRPEFMSEATMLETCDCKFPKRCTREGEISYDDLELGEGKYIATIYKELEKHPLDWWI